MLGNCKRSRFIAAVLVAVIGFLKWQYPELPVETIYGFCGYILGESFRDAFRAFGPKEPAKPPAEVSSGETA